MFLRAIFAVFILLYVSVYLRVSPIHLVLLCIPFLTRELQIVSFNRPQPKRRS